MSAIVRSIIALLLGLFLVLPVAAREEIRSFTADIVLDTDGTVFVTETLVVNAEGNEIRRGIYRDIPVVMLGSDGGKVRPDLEVTGVTRDGDQEMFRVERMGNFQRIWIGNPDAFLDYGVHRYTIRYTMTRMARAFDDHDELYWNATGNYWIFPILEARANVTLPDGAVISNLAGYTGAVGSTEQAVSIKRSSDTTAAFRASRALGAGEGMTIAVAFNKGVVAFPTGLAAFQQRLGDLREIILPVLAVLLAIAYNALAWFRVGRDPEKGTIIPLFHPPKGFSPPLVHYVHKWGFANSGWVALTSAIFDLGVRGLVTIDNAASKLRITTTGKQPDEPLSPGERVLFDYLGSRGTVVIDKTTGPELQKKRADFTRAIETENRSLWFRNNTGYAVLGFILALALLGGMVATDILSIEWLIGAAVIGIFAGVILGAVGGMRQGLRFLPFIGVFWLSMFGINALGALVDGLGGFAVNTAAISAISIVAVTIVFAVLMRAPTLQGRKVMDQIDGLKLYIETAEKERLNMVGAPPMTVNRFERILPYAIALGVERPWSSHFEAELARHAVADAGDTYQPAWYHGGSPGSAARSASNMTNAVSAAAASMTAAMVAAQPVQASSSGFSSGGGGGGSSGGGGGGGGGGGW
jgi:Predicted membrane protein